MLPGLTVDGKEVVGCVVKASQGTGWGKGNEQWFARSWGKLHDAAGEQYGVDFFRGCYHFLVFSQDGGAQADYFCDQVEAAGGFDSGDLMPWMDVEEGGQGSWAPQRLETITDSSLRNQLADNVTTCTRAFVDRFKQRTGLRIAVYGRGIFRDLQMTDCTFGGDGSVNPAIRRRCRRWTSTAFHSTRSFSGSFAAMGPWRCRDTRQSFPDGIRRITASTSTALGRPRSPACASGASRVRLEAARGGGGRLKPAEASTPAGGRAPR